MSSGFQELAILNFLPVNYRTVLILKGSAPQTLTRKSTHSKSTRIIFISMEEKKYKFGKQCVLSTLKQDAGNHHKEKKETRGHTSLPPINMTVS